MVASSAMVTPKGLFSEVPCPYLKGCKVPACIFWHPGPDEEPQTVDARDSDEIDREDDVEKSRRKRQKLGVSQLSTDSKGQPAPTLKPDASKSQISKSTSLVSIDQKRTTTASTRSISPPPLRRAAQTRLEDFTPKLNDKISTSKPNVTPSSKTAAPVVTPPSEDSTPAVKTSVSRPPKREGLNPRTLKFPSPATHDMRYRLLKALHDQFQRLNSELVADANSAEEELVLSDQALITKALDIEEDAALRPSIYSNVVKNKILIYKRMTVAQWKDERAIEVSSAKALETASLLDIPISQPEAPPKPIETGLTTEQELFLLHRLYTPITAAHTKHNYVRSIPTPEEIDSANRGVEAAKGWEVCDRCKSRFQVFPGRREEDGALASGGMCTYHYGRTFFQDRQPGDTTSKRVKKYRCCGQSMGDSAGCTQAQNHVFKISEVKRLAAILNFEETPENPVKVEANPVCFDCEMGYTVHGLELIRLTTTSWPSGDELFDVLVRPIGEVIDLNSRFSGVWPQHMVDALPWDPNSTPESDTGADGKRRFRIMPSPAAARALFFSHIAPNTPLIGHALENDLNATRLIHPTIIDTALLYPHPRGLPARNGLKNLMQIHLNRQIQVVVGGDMQGHDSKEDANAAGMLVRYALGEEWRKMQREGWKLVDGEFVPPAEGKMGGFPGMKISSRLSVVELEAHGKRKWEEVGMGDGEVQRKKRREELEEGEVDG